MEFVEDGEALRIWNLCSNNYYLRSKFLEDNFVSPEFMKQVLPDESLYVNVVASKLPDLPKKVIRELEVYALSLGNDDEIDKYNILANLVFQENAEPEAFNKYEAKYLPKIGVEKVRQPDYASQSLLEKWFFNDAPEKYMGTVRTIWMRTMWFKRTSFLNDYPDLISTQFLFFMYFGDFQGEKAFHEYLNEHKDKKIELAKMLLRVIGYGDELDTMAGSWIVELARNEGYFLG